MAIVTGVLQSLVPATQSNIGASFLRSLYENLHHNISLDFIGTPELYFIPMNLSSLGVAFLVWWRTVLQEGILSRRVQMVEKATLALVHGDDSGTGSGRTQKFIHAFVGGRPSSLEVWMGSWNPLFPGSTSNWKEMRTLVQVLEIEPLGSSRFQGQRLYYCTDNSVTHDSVLNGSSKSPKLHKLVMRLKVVELQHNYVLVVIRIPGVAMIGGGTDGQSREVWANALTIAGSYHVSDLFQWTPPSPALLSWALSLSGTPHQLPYGTGRLQSLIGTLLS